MKKTALNTIITSSLLFVPSVPFAADLGLTSEFGVIVLGDYDDTVESATTNALHSSTLINGDVITKNTIGGNVPYDPLKTKPWVLVAGGDVEVQGSAPILLNRGHLWQGGKLTLVSDIGIVGKPYIDQGKLNICGRPSDDQANCYSIDWENSLSTPYHQTKPYFMACFDSNTGTEVSDTDCINDPDRLTYKFRIKDSDRLNLFDLGSTLNDPTAYPSNTALDCFGWGCQLTLNDDGQKSGIQVAYVTLAQLTQSNWSIEPNGFTKTEIQSMDVNTDGQPDGVSIIINVIDAAGQDIDITNQSSLPFMTGATNPTDCSERAGFTFGSGFLDYHDCKPPVTSGGYTVIETSPTFASRVILNFTGAKSIKSPAMHGMLLAPAAKVDLTSGNATGPIIVDTLKGNATASSSGFSGSISSAGCPAGNEFDIDLVGKTEYNDLEKVFPYTVSTSSISSTGTSTYTYEILKTTWYKNFDGLLKNEAFPLAVGDSSAAIGATVGNITLEVPYLGEYLVTVKASDNNSTCTSIQSFSFKFSSKYSFH
ncbi:choice-of-anchor A family protein [Catenovulum sp. SM1970]|uniref:collagen-binding domain-containing protein n=1 Tax=Marinifaba aquimaris TaxID=2741323 RepID=UPI0015727B38|nr:collagen-binding domain-containing protein [Marinifaba aquimaris]NTS77160.1 choice-of-anchor A family protein [Marinifaba aquimaris]